MEFRLYYKGELKSANSATIEDKQKVRRYFHPQLKNLWNQDPLKDYLYDDSGHLKPFLCNEKIGDFKFLPLINKHVFLVADLNIVFLRPEPPGSVMNKGDIDNRVKTLIDSLRMPTGLNEIPKGDTPRENEIPYFFCLLEDDRLITSLAITTDRLLLEPGPDLSESEVILLIYVHTKVSRATIDNISLGI